MGYHIGMRHLTYLAIIAVYAGLPAYTHAQNTNESIQDFIGYISVFINNTLIPLILAIALVVFLWNVTRFFILGGTSDESRAKAKQLAIYSIAAFVIIISIWAIVNLIVSSLGFRDGGAPVMPDYIQEETRGSGFGGWDPWGRSSGGTTVEESSWSFQFDFSI